MPRNYSLRHQVAHFFYLPSRSLDRLPPTPYYPLKAWSSRLLVSAARFCLPSRLLLAVVLSLSRLPAVDSPQNTALKPLAYFTDIAKQAGLTMTNTFGGVAAKKYIIETTGTGVAIFDYDNDGWPDIFIVNGTKLDGFPANQALPPIISIATITTARSPMSPQKAGLAHSGWGQGVCVGDYDNDGFEDLYVTYYGKNVLYHNNGNGTFTDVSEKAGVAGSGKAWGTGCAFVDYDRDGHLDLMVANYVDFDLATTPGPGERPTCLWKGAPVMCGPQGLPGAKNILYHNRGDGTFEDVTTKSHIDQTDGHYAFSVTTLDYDDDGWPDIFVACDSTPSILYHNNRDGTFKDVAVTAGAAFNEDGRSQAGMGSTAADYNGDGRLDIFKTNFSDDTATLYRNNGDGTFDDVTYPAGLGLHTQYLGWGTMFFDFDNDSWPDLLLVNGHVYPEVDTQHLGSNFQEPRILYHNNGNGTFTDISATAGPGINTVSSSRGLAIGDLWNDGHLSAVVSNMNAPPSLLVNQIRNANHWVAIRPGGTFPVSKMQSPTTSIGPDRPAQNPIAMPSARAFALKPARALSLTRCAAAPATSPTTTYVSISVWVPPPTIDWVEVRWPSGLVEKFERPRTSMRSIL